MNLVYDDILNSNFLFVIQIMIKLRHRIDLFKGHWQRKFLFAFSIAMGYLTVKILLFPAQTA